jgi:hypothetical protein
MAGLDRQGRLIILLDGLDEMSREQYNEHIEAISTFPGGKGMVCELCGKVAPVDPADSTSTVTPYFGDNSIRC